MAYFKTIRQTAKLGLISEHHLRLMVSQKRCPGIYAGNKFLVNVNALAELLESESRRCMQDNTSSTVIVDCRKGATQ